MFGPAELLTLKEGELIELQHYVLLELLRRYPPTWPTAPAYHIASRIFQATMELHQALSEHVPAESLYR